MLVAHARKFGRQCYKPAFPGVPTNKLQTRFVIIQVNELSTGDYIQWKGKILEVVKREHGTSGRRATAFILTELKDLAGKKHEERFRTSEKIEVLDVSSKYLDYIETDEEAKTFVFDHEEQTYEIPIDFFGDKGVYIQEGITVVVRYIDEKPINWNFLTTVAPYLVVDTREFAGEDNHRPKPAFLANGKKIKVPPFVEKGEMINIDLKQETFHSRVE